MTDVKQRSQVIDRVRGVALLLVILGHTMTGSTTQAQSTIVFRVIWSLQMPLFFLISGYVTRFGSSANNVSALLRQIVRRTIQLLLPFAVWTFLVRGILFGQTAFLRVDWLAHHMDSGYWFLFSLWVISIGFYFSAYLSEKNVFQHRIAWRAVFLGLFVTVLALIAHLCGGDFLGGKLTMYYALFFLIGAFVGAVRGKVTLFRKTIYLCVLVCLVVWLIMVFCFDFYSTADDLSHIFLRAMCSLFGCIGVFGIAAVLERWKGLPLLRKVLCWIGTHTLELYLVHYLCLNLIRILPPPMCESMCGISLVALNFSLTLLMSALVTALLIRIPVVRLALYGKLEKRINNYG